MEEIICYGKLHALSKIDLIAIDEQLNIKHANSCAKKLLELKSSDVMIGTSIISVFEQFGSPNLIDHKGDISSSARMLINDRFYQWKSLSILVENARWKLLIGYVIPSGINKELENTLKKDKLYLTNIIENLPQLVYWKDRNFLYQGCNKSAAKILHLNTPKDIINKSDYDFGWPPERIKALQDVDKLILNEGITSIVEDVIPTNGSPRIFLTSKSPMRNENGKIIGVLGISTDISEQKNMEAALLVAKEAAEAANHAKSEFIANMSHDIRTPLTGVVGMSKILEDSTQDPNQKKYAHYLGESGDQLLHMLNGILDVISADNANETDVHEEPFDLRHIMKDILQLERPTALLKGLDLIIQVDEAVPLCLVSDHTKIHRILLNLMGNAIKFTANGQVEVGVKCLHITKTHALLQFRVADTGIGISPELQDKVFDRFFRVAPAQKTIYTGHGVGLHIAQSYAHLLGGNIVLTSALGVGTTFYFELSLPIGDGSLLPSPTTTEPFNDTTTIVPPTPLPEPTVVLTKTVSLPANAPHLLLIEDNPIALIVLENLVASAHCQFTSAIDGESGLELAKTQPFDLIITDLGLPGMSGSEMTTQLRVFEMEHHKKPVPIIGLTAHADDKSKQECIQSGMNEALTKPMQAHTLETIKSTYLTPDKTTSTPIDMQKPTVTGSKLGVDLPDTEEELFLLHDLPVLNADAALKLIGNNVSLLKDILKSLAEEGMKVDLDDMDRAHEQGNWESVEKIAHRMKGGYVYCGLTKLAMACQYLERYRKAGHASQLEALYQQLRKVADETTTTINRWLLTS